MENNSGFPELRYFRFEDRERWDSDARVFQYCCEKSPKLEEIHLVDYRSDPRILENVSRSMGSLASRLGWFTTYLGNVLFSDSHFYSALFLLFGIFNIFSHV